MDQVGPADKPIDRILLFREGKEPVVFAEPLNAIFGMVWHDGALYVMIGLQSPGRRDLPAPRAVRSRPAAEAGGDLRRRRVRPADRRRQHRQPAARPPDRPPGGDDRPRRPRRLARQAAARVPHPEPPAGGGRQPGRSSGGRLADRAAARLEPDGQRRDRQRDARIRHQREVRRTRAGPLGWAHPAHRAGVRAAARAARRARRPAIDPQGRRAGGDGRHRRPPRAERAGDLGDRHRRGPVGRHRADDQELSPRRHRAVGIRHRPPAGIRRDLLRTAPARARRARRLRRAGAGASPRPARRGCRHRDDAASDVRRPQPRRGHPRGQRAAATAGLLPRLPPDGLPRLLPRCRHPHPARPPDRRHRPARRPEGGGGQRGFRRPFLARPGSPRQDDPARPGGRRAAAVRRRRGGGGHQGGRRPRRRDDFRSVVREAIRRTRTIWPKT